MASSAFAAAATTVVVFAIMVLSSLGHQETGPLCSDCGLLCTTNCTAEIDTRCRMYCDNPAANTQECQRQVFQACTLSFCCNGNCSRDCIMEGQNGCHVHDTTTDCQNCRGGILSSCIPDCNSYCNSTCVKKEQGC